jgi:hypothetical protein
VTTKSKEEALDLLAHARADLLVKARKFALQLAQSRGEICALEVRIAMEKRGLLTSGEMALDGRWIGVLFSDRRTWEGTGRHVQMGYRKRNVHVAARKLWRLRDPARKLLDRGAKVRTPSRCRIPPEEQQALDFD